MSTSPRRLLLAGAASIVVMAIGVVVVDQTAGGGSSSDTPSTTGDGISTASNSPGGDDLVTELDIVDFAFEPTPATVSAGSTVRIVNSDGTKHTVTSGSRDDAGKVFDVALDPNGTGELVIDEPGTYTYICRIHPGMKGTLEVVR
jgi:plastocyanin